MEEFNIKKYRSWLFNNKNYSHKYLEKYISAISQFEIVSYKYAGVHQETFSRSINKIFKTLLIDKPHSVHVRDFLLYLYGFKYCTQCIKIIKLNFFTKNKNSWDGLEYRCKFCDKILRKDFRNKNPDYHKKWKKENSHKVLMYGSKRRASEINAMPNWLNVQHLKQIEDKYLEAKSKTNKTKIKYHVHHIIPLQGKYVSGLHVPWNLEVITKKENLSKNNYHESEEYWK